MAYTVDQLDALKDALASGALVVKYADKEVTYRSTEQMLLIMGVMETELGLLGLNNTNGNRRYGSFFK